MQRPSPRFVLRSAWPPGASQPLFDGRGAKPFQQRKNSPSDWTSCLSGSERRIRAAPQGRPLRGPRSIWPPRSPHKAAPCGRTAALAVGFESAEPGDNAKTARPIGRAVCLAAREGFEPSQTESESVVLPLHNLAKRKNYYTAYPPFVKRFFQISSDFFAKRLSKPAASAYNKENTSSGRMAG